MTVPMGPWLVGFRGQIIPLFIVGDVISDNWDGLIPPDLSGTDPDLTATQGYALDASSGSAQFNGTLFLQGELKVGENADVFIGGPGSVDAQLFIDNILQHLNMRETDDPDYPDKIFIIDVNGGIGRLFWLDTTGGGEVFTEGLEVHQDGTIITPTGPLLIDEGTVTDPGLAYAAATGDGFYHASGRISGAIGGVEVSRMGENPFVNLPAYRRTGSNQTIPNNTTTAVTFGTLAWDYGFDPITFSSPTYTVPIDGLLDIFYFAQWDTNVAGRRRDRILLNGSVVAQSQYTGNTTEPSITTCCCIEVSAGDTIDIDALQNSGGDLILISKRLTLAYRPNGIMF